MLTDSRPCCNMMRSQSFFQPLDIVSLLKKARRCYDIRSLPVKRAGNMFRAGFVKRETVRNMCVRRVLVVWERESISFCSGSRHCQNFREKKGLMVSADKNIEGKDRCMASEDYKRVNTSLNRSLAWVHRVSLRSDRLVCWPSTYSVA